MTSLVVTGSHPLMQKIRSLASRLATCDTAALILGEAGTAKRDLACHIHQQSRRAGGPFMSANAAGLSAEDLAGVVKDAHGGTLLLGNVDALDPELHPLVLDLLERKDSWRSSCMGANVRLIASVEPDLPPTVSDANLYERFGRVSLFLPPLRERRSDIPLLIRHLLDKYASENDGPARRIPNDTQVLLWQYDWPGNLRELAEVVRQCADGAVDGLIRPALLPAHIRWSFRQGAAVTRSGERIQGALAGTRDDDRDPSVLH